MAARKSTKTKSKTKKGTARTRVKARRPVAKKGKVLHATRRQIGKTTVSRDRKRKAMKPGKRLSRYGRIYHEYRKNRSDLRGGV